jgi:hypothetical protein
MAELMERRERLRRAAQFAQTLLELKQERAQLLAAARLALAQQREVQALAATAEELEADIARQDVRFCAGPPQWEAPAEPVEGGVWGPWLKGHEFRYGAIQMKLTGVLRAVAESPEPLRLQIYNLPFAMGGLRLAYYAR